MFNLESSITAWRSQMLAAGIQTPVPLAELESHLRDDIAQQISAGVDPEEAFAICVRCIGHANPLQTEFAKVDESKYARQSKWMRIFCQSFAGLILLWCIFGLTHLPLSATQKISGFVAAALSALIWAAVPWFYRWSPVVPNKRKREWLQATCAIFYPLVGGIVFRFVAPQLELSMDQLLTANLWSLVPTGIFQGFAIGMGEAARRPRTVSTF